MHTKLLKYVIRISDEIDIAIQKRTKISVKQKLLEKKMDLSSKKSKTLDKELGITK